MPHHPQICRLRGTPPDVRHVGHTGKMRRPGDPLILPPEPDDILDPVRARMPEGYARVGVGQGWWPLIATLDADLAALDPDYKVVQVKADMAKLQYSIATSLTGDELLAFRAFIRAAEHASWHMCEACGKPGKQVIEKQWILVYCEDHRAYEDEERHGRSQR